MPTDDQAARLRAIHDAEVLLVTREIDLHAWIPKAWASLEKMLDLVREGDALRQERDELVRLNHKWLIDYGMLAKSKAAAEADLAALRSHLTEQIAEWRAIAARNGTDYGEGCADCADVLERLLAAADPPEAQP